MSKKLITNDLTSIIGYDLIDVDLKNKIGQNTKLINEVDNWTKKYVNNRHAFGIKECNVQYIDYENIDIDELDDVERSELLKKIKKNDRLCPNHRNCVLFKNNCLSKGSKCILEVADATTIRQALYEELDIQPDDYNDIISVDKLVSVNVIGNRALRGLSSEALIDTVATYSKGGVKYDTKINENFAVYEKTQLLAEKLQKNLILNREDKAKYKQLVETKTKEDVENNVKNIIKQVEDSFDMNDIIDIVNAEEVGMKEQPKIDTESDSEHEEIIDIES